MFCSVFVCLCVFLIRKVGLNLLQSIFFPRFVLPGRTCYIHVFRDHSHDHLNDPKADGNEETVWGGTS